MADERPILTLAHSPDPDDAFMWWPMTGKVAPDGTPRDPEAATAIDTGRFRFRAVPADIEALNRRAAAAGDLDITALSFRAYCDVKDRYIVTHCGSSFGDGFGPKVIASHALAERVRAHGAAALVERSVAIPGRRTTAFLLLSIFMGEYPPGRVVEMPFDQVIGAVARGDTEAGVVIHEGQLLFAEAGLELGVDLGAWWKVAFGFAVPLGCNAIKRDLDARFGPGSSAEVVRLLRSSIEYALAHRAESLEYTMPFALANAAKPGAERSGLPTLERVDRYVDMYVNPLTVDMGGRGRAAVVHLLRRGHELGLCPDPGPLDIA
ncbi:MAG: ABC transporter substrate-binding protein [Planctomycetes bacterium]|nr:ABC transporter substrate-binding protein [Planctomycetota bacterium]